MIDRSKVIQNKEAIDKQLAYDKELELQIANQKEDLLLVLSTKEGRRFYWRAMDRCKPFKTAKHNSGSETYFNLGEQNIGLWLWDLLMDANPEIYIQMTLENRKLDA